MRVILLTDIHKIGQRHDVKNVAPGLAMNKLIPQKLAEVATKGALKELEKKVAERDALKIKEAEEILANQSKLENLEVIIEEKANDKGNLFAGIDKERIAKEISKASGIPINSSFVDLKEPIKKAGDKNVAINIGEIEISVRIVVKGL